MKSQIPESEYYLKDHLGNTRIVINNNAQLVEQHDYYPFGLEFAGRQGGDIKYRYNGKELQDMKIGGRGLDWYDYGARFYEPALGRWHVLDPLAEKAYETSSYVYVRNNPLNAIDPDGREDIMAAHAADHVAIFGGGSSTLVGGPIFASKRPDDLNDKFAWARFQNYMYNKYAAKSNTPNGTESASGQDNSVEQLPTPSAKNTGPSISFNNVKNIKSPTKIISETSSHTFIHAPMWNVYQTTAAGVSSGDGPTVIKNGVLLKEIEKKIGPFNLTVGPNIHMISSGGFGIGFKNGLLTNSYKVISGTNLSGWDKEYISVTNQYQFNFRDAAKLLIYLSIPELTPIRSITPALETIPAY